MNKCLKQSVTGAIKRGPTNYAEGKWDWVRRFYQAIFPRRRLSHALVDDAPSRTFVVSTHSDYIVTPSLHPYRRPASFLSCILHRRRCIIRPNERFGRRFQNFLQTEMIQCTLAAWHTAHTWHLAFTDTNKAGTRNERMINNAGRHAFSI